MTYTIVTKKKWSQTQQELSINFEKWNVTEWETNYPRGARLEGFSQSEQDRTVTLRYKKNGREVTLKMGNQARAADNLRVLLLAIESIRLNEKRGIGEVLESAYLQLAAPEVFDPYQILGVFRDAPIEVAEAAYKARAIKAHPDHGGSQEEMTRLNKAIEMIRKEHHGTIR